MQERFDVVVVGAGPGGYTAAIRAAQGGLHTAIVEREDLGGICLNRGCIPSKAMLRSAEVLDLLEHAADYGLHVQGIRADYAAVTARRDRTVSHLLQGVTNLLRGNGVAVLRGDARLLDPHRLIVTSAAGQQMVDFDHLIIATGSSSAALPVPGADRPGVIDSDGALKLKEAPRRAVVIGGGAVGVEWAAIWRAFGSEVTVIEMLPQIIPTEEPEIARELTRAFANQGITTVTGATVQEIQSGVDGLQVTAAVGGETRTFDADVVLVAVGRRPHTDGLGLQEAGVEVDGRRISTDGHGRTNVAHIFAIGDVTGRYLLAHTAAHQGIIAAEAIAQHQPEPFDDRIVPAAIFTHPEVASVGLREQQAVAAGRPVRSGRFPFAASGRAQASGHASGFVKLVADADSGEVLGAHIIGPAAGELIGEISLGMRFHATIDDLAATVHIHPTFSEALHEAAMLAAGTPIHVPPRRVGSPTRP
jgi:dihydrolipoamide dehydrogenase